MRKRYKNSEYLMGEPDDATHLIFLHLNQAEERKLQAIIEVLAEHGWRYQEEVKDNGYPCVVSLMVKDLAGEVRTVFLDLRSSLLLYDLGLLLTHIEQAEHPHLTAGLQGLESLLRQRQREAELLEAYRAKHQRR
jgi:hypothetical protein